jgi:enamine deaminase RidA (YjgF/YER057c/UK114 family)
MVMPHPVEDQARNALATIEKALIEGGFALGNVVRATYYVINVDEWQRAIPVLGEVFGGIRPAATAIIAGLTTPEMKIEIEVTAFKG